MAHTRRWRIPLGALAATSLLLAGCGGSGDGAGGSGEAEVTGIFADAPVAAELPEGSTMAEIKERGELVVAAALDAPLLSQQDPTDPDKVEGFDITLAKLLATYILGEPAVKIVPPATETREAMLQNDTVDVVFNTYSITEERAEQVQFAGPYFVSGQAIAVPAGNPDGIEGMDDLAGQPVIVGANTPGVEFVKQEAPTAELVTFGTDPQAIAGLAQGRGVAYVQDYMLLATDNVSNKDFEIVTDALTVDPYGIGLPPDDPEFKEFVNEWLAQIQDDGLWAQAFEESIGAATGQDAPEPPEIGSVPGS